LRPSLMRILKSDVGIFFSFQGNLGILKRKLVVWAGHR
jgi:hypothetical protein